jgi:nucleotide-binding universal stress UspA family protein
MSDGKLDFGSLPRLLVSIGAGNLRGNVLLALEASEPAPFATLHRSAALSVALRADLHVLRVMSASARRPRSARSLDTLMLDDALTMHAARRATRARIGSLLGRELPWERHHVDTGSFVETVARQALILRARFVVLPAHEHVGQTAVSIVRRSGVFVLVARSCTSDRTILAQTESESVDEILKEAYRFDADLIVTRTRSPSWLPSTLVRDEASELVDRASASVLLAPPDRPICPGIA